MLCCKKIFTAANDMKEGVENEAVTGRQIIKVIECFKV